MKKPLMLRLWLCPVHRAATGIQADEIGYQYCRRIIRGKRCDRPLYRAKARTT